MLALPSQCATHTNLGYQITVVPEITAPPPEVTEDGRGILACAITTALMAMLTIAL